MGREKVRPHGPSVVVPQDEPPISLGSLCCPVSPTYLVAEWPNLPRRNAAHDSPTGARPHSRVIDPDQLWPPPETCQSNGPEFPVDLMPTEIWPWAGTVVLPNQVAMSEL